MRAISILCLVVLTLLYAVSCCEEETHYKRSDGKCCKKCGPGKRMLKDDNCEDPRCQDCQDGEYQSGYTSETKCERQPSCDTNLHFLPEIKPSKSSLSKCKCESGYFCTEEDDCSVCREHTVCKPGQRVFKKGTSESDTVCGACEEGKFSTNYSVNTCTDWTICGQGYVESAPGSSTSDRTCVGSPVHRAAIGVGITVVVLVIIGALVVFIVKRNNSWTKVKIPKAQITGLNFKRHQPDADLERAEQPLNQQPEEVEEHTPASPTLSNMTENGNFVAQEDGKPSINPTTESNSYAYS